MFLQSIWELVSRAVAGYRGESASIGRLVSSPHNWTGASPPRERFYLSTDELKMVGLALNHYKQRLRSQKEWEKVEKIADLDNRLFNFLTFLESKTLEKPQISEVA
ncbi:MAG: hypothetical protein MUE85_01630 [Microscillaceae bacterium]|jgi:hypothetical protein|nr:hypothetical protein [Microscillaceae bacterium]